MKSITIHKMGSPLVNAIEDFATSKNLSLNKAIQKLLTQALGLSERASQQQRRYLALKKLSAFWSNEDRDEFEKNVEDLSEIDVAEWE